MDGILRLDWEGLDHRVRELRRLVRCSQPPLGSAVSVFGSFTRLRAPRDVDLLVIYSPAQLDAMNEFCEKLRGGIVQVFDLATDYVRLTIEEEQVIGFAARESALLLNSH